MAGDLSKHFGDVVGRKLPKADLPVLLECLSLDSGIPLGGECSSGIIYL